ncbi:MAG: hypothetical protein QOI85_437 [Chloroflexota bacterium]|jgi:hypothetical protein|nr:hypothetical protein [Chloroflexota bacterium]
MASRDELTTLTDRWRERHDARRPLDDVRPPADPEREELAARAFPFRSVDPAAYVAEHGPAMIGFTYDERRFADPELDAWLLEVGRLLRARR